jgi:hypothetical protein
MAEGVVRHCQGCRARLAWDNAEVFCSPCRRTRRNAVQPPDVPAEFWETPELQSAFGEWHIGQVIRAYRTHEFHGPKPLAQDVVAGWLHLTQAQISRIESGPAVTDLARLVPWARTLGIPQRWLWFKVAQQPAPERPALPVVHRVAATPPAGWPTLGVDDLPRVTVALKNPYRYFDDSVVAVLRRQLEASKADDGQLGPTTALPVVLGVLGAVREYAREVKRDVRRSLLHVGSDSAEFAGWLYRDLRDLQTATYWYDRAMEWAQEADDPAMQGYVLLRKSQLAYDQREPGRVLSLAEAAERTSGELPRGVRAEVTQQEALGLAMLGEPLVAVERKLDGARQLLGKGTSADGQELGSYFTDGMLLLRSTACYTEAGKPAQAAELLDGVISGGRLSPRDAGYFTARRAAALALSGEPDEAARLGLEALQVATTTRSGRTLAVLTDVIQVLERWQGRPQVRMLREALKR